jgi:hypothetical protein
VSGGLRGGFDDAADINWRQLGDAEFVARAMPVAEAWLTAPRVEVRLVVGLDDELVQRQEAQRARRRRSGSASEADLRPLEYLLLMTMDRMLAEGADGGAALVTRGLRLSGLHALGCLLEGEAIAAPTWSLAHRFYVHAETQGVAGVAGEPGVAPQALYVRMLLLSTLVGNGMTPRQVDKCFDWLEQWSRGIALDPVRDPARHYFAVDLGGGGGLEEPSAQLAMKTPRWLDHAPLSERVAGARADYFRQISVATLGLYETNPLFEYHDALFQLNRYWEYVGVRHAGRDTGRRRTDAVQVTAVTGFEACARVAAGGTGGTRWMLVDQSPTGAGFRVQGVAMGLEKGALTLFQDPQGGGWILGASVRVAASVQGLSVGVKRLADEWRPLRLKVEGDEASPDLAGFFIFGDEARGLADSIIVQAGTFDPARTFTMRPGRDLFRIRLSRVIQSAGDWERVGFDVLKRLSDG